MSQRSLECSDKWRSSTYGSSHREVLAAEDIFAILQPSQNSRPLRYSGTCVVSRDFHRCSPENGGPFVFVRVYSEQ